MNQVMLRVLIFISLYVAIKRKISVESVRWTLLLSVLLLLAYLYAIGASTSFFSILWNILPSARFFRFPTKVLYVIEFCLAILSGLGLDYVLRLVRTRFDARPLSNRIVVGIGVCLICVTYLDLWVFNRPIQPTVDSSAWLSTPPLAAYIQSQEGYCQCQNSLDSGTFQNWRVYAKPTFLKDSSRLDDIALQKDVQNLENSDFNMLAGISNIKEYAGLFVQRQDKLNTTTTSINWATHSVIIPEETKRVWDLQAARFYLTDIPITHRDLVLRKTEKYHAAYDHRLDLLPSSGVIKEDSIKTDTAYVYENLHYYPRAQLIDARNALYMQSEDHSGQSILKAVIDPKFDPATHVIIDIPHAAVLPSDAENVDSTSSFSFLSYTPQNFRVLIHNSRSNYFVLADTYYPGWHALLDNKEVRIDKANYAFRAVFIPSGEHTLRMYYEPTYWRVSMYFVSAGVGIVLVILFWCGGYWVKRRYSYPS